MRKLVLMRQSHALALPAGRPASLLIGGFTACAQPLTCSAYLCRPQFAARFSHNHLYQHMCGFISSALLDCFFCMNVCDQSTATRAYEIDIVDGNPSFPVVAWNCIETERRTHCVRVWSCVGVWIYIRQYLLLAFIKNKCFPAVSVKCHCLKLRWIWANSGTIWTRRITCQGFACYFFFFGTTILVGTFSNRFREGDLENRWFYSLLHCSYTLFFLPPFCTCPCLWFWEVLWLRIILCERCFSS